MNAAHLGISSIVGALLLISIAAGSGSLMYTYVMNSSQALQQNPSNYSIFEIPTGGATGYSLRFYLLNLGKQQLILDGTEKVYVTTPNDVEYSFSEVSSSNNVITFGCSCMTNSTATVYLLPHQTIEFVLWSSFQFVPGDSYTVLLTLGDGSQTVATIMAH